MAWILRLNRTVQYVIKEVQLNENAVRKRMQEFCETASSELTLEELQLVDLEEGHDPPAFLKSRKKRNSIFVSLFRMTTELRVACYQTMEKMFHFEEEINRLISLSLTKKRGP